MVGKLRSIKGFSLVEVVIALAVLIFGLFGVLELYMNSKVMIARSEMKIQAVELARNGLEELKGLGYDYLSNKIDSSSDSPLTLPDSSPSESKDPHYQWLAALSRNPDNPDMIEIVYTVKYTTSGDTRKEVILRDIVTK